MSVPPASVTGWGALIRRGAAAWLRQTVAAVIVALALHAPDASAGSAPKLLSDSFREVPETGAAGSGRASIARHALRPEEEAELLEFQVALPMRSLPELQARVQRGERIAATEMEAAYYPLATDYEVVASWLTGQGLEITLRDPHRLGIFARGPVALVRKAFQVEFARVDTAEGQFTSAVTAPNIPDALAASVLGVNGLQPHIRPRRHSTLQALVPGSTTGNGPPFLPRQLAHAYHADALAVTGAGQKIGIVIDTFPATSDLTSFWSACQVNQSLGNVEFVQVVSGTLPAASGEETLDVEWAGAMAPGAKVRVYATTSLSYTNIDKAYQQILLDAAGDPTLRQISLSYGLGETYATLSQIRTDDQYFSSMAGAGITVLVASGDGGSSPGTTGHDHSGPTQAETPASDPNVTGVGGTSLYVDATTGNTTSESAWYDGGGGVSQYFTRPGWQTGSGVPTGTKRLIPDVAAAADGSTGGYLIFGGQAYIVGGTSWSAPVWAGFSALINQSRAAASLTSLGSLGPKLYPLLGSTAFSDITTGNNGPNGVYNAGAGYDLCTGVGVPNVGVLLQLLTPIPPAISSQPVNASVPAGQYATFAVTATGSAPLTYQWQVSTNAGTTWGSLSESSAASGTTTSSLTLLGVAAVQSGNQYRCVAGNAYGSATSGSATLTVVLPPVITSAATVSGTVGTPFSFAISASNTPTSFGASGLPSGLTLASATGVITGTPATAGTCAVTVTATNAAGTGSAKLTLVVALGSATVSLAGLSPTYDGFSHPVTVQTVPAGLPVTVSYNGSLAAPTDAGSYLVAVSVTDPNYSGSATGTLNIAQAPQTIAFPTLPAVHAGDSPLVPAATATSGLPVSYASDTAAVAVILNGSIHPVGAGTAKITASQAGDGNFLPAVSVSQTLTVAPAVSPEGSDVPALPPAGAAILALLLALTALPWLRRTRTIPRSR